MTKIVGVVHVVYLVIFLFSSADAAITFPASGKTCPPGWLVSSNKCYLNDLNMRSWTSCRSYCTSVGGRMPCIENSAENVFVQNRMVVTAWIGKNRLPGPSNPWGWDSGAVGACPSTYTNWAGGEPNNGLGGPAEMCVEQLVNVGRWNDNPCSNTIGCFCENTQVVTQSTVCPIGWTVSGDGKSCYYFSNELAGYTWDSCNSFCAAQGEGVDMLCVESAAQHAFIWQKMPNKNTWIGYKKVNNQFHWNDGCPSTYTNWRSGQPNGLDGYAVNIGSYSNGQWDDIPSSSTANCACQIRTGFNPTTMPTTVPTAMPTVPPSRTVPYKVSNGFAFAVVTGNRSMLSWGEAAPGGAASQSVRTQLASEVSSIVPSRHAYTALKTDGSLVPWGVPSHYAGTLPTVPVSKLVATTAAFAAITATGAVRAFGAYQNGGNVVDNVKSNGFASYLTSGVQALIASSASFTALKADGTVFTWGSKFCGGGVSSLTVPALIGVVKVSATMEAFAALLSTGRVLTWGGQYSGGDSSAVASQLLANVKEVVGGKAVFAAFKTDDSLVVWGFEESGGAPSSAVAAALSTGVSLVAFSSMAMAAVHLDGTVTAWGDVTAGGDASAVQAQLVNVDTIVGNSYAFAALTVSGAVVAWGNAVSGGVIPSDKVSALSSGVISIYHTDRAFAALKEDRSVVVWGEAGHGGSPGPAVESLLTSGVHTICSNDVAFSAIKVTGEVVAWGHPVSVPAPGLQFFSYDLKNTVQCA